MVKAHTPVWMRIAVIALAFVLYVVACVLPVAASTVASNNSRWILLGNLFWGWGPHICLPWSSNFFWVIGMMLLAAGRPWWAWGCSIVGLLLATRVLHPYPAAELLGAKYWWLASYAVLVAGCGAACVRSCMVNSPPKAPDAEPVPAHDPGRDDGFGSP